MTWKQKEIFHSTSSTEGLIRMPLQSTKEKRDQFSWRKCKSKYQKHYQISCLRMSTTGCDFTLRKYEWDLYQPEQQIKKEIAILVSICTNRNQREPSLQYKRGKLEKMMKSKRMFLTFVIYIYTVHNLVIWQSPCDNLSAD